VTAATVVSRQTQDYLAAVEHELADLSAEDRSALLEDLALHLEALAAEDDDRPIAVRLGPPAAYAADLRAAAGLPARAAGLRMPTLGLQERLVAIRETAAFQRVRPALHATRGLLAELRPAWWVLRGYLLVLVPCLLKSDGVRDFPVPAPLGSHVLGLLLVVAAVAASVALGRRSFPRWIGACVVFGGLLLLSVGAVVGQHAWSGMAARAAAADDFAWVPGPDVPSETYPLLSRYGPVTDVLPYAADGTPIEGVLLYDQDGRPLHVGVQQWWADSCLRFLSQPRAADGVPVPNSFPQAYELAPGNVSTMGTPMAPGICVKNIQRPEVPLPTFPAKSAAPVPGG